jgi:hypothetical protein
MNFTFRYKQRLHDSMLQFTAKFSDIDAISQQTLAAELKQHQAQTKWWKRKWQNILRRFTNEPERVLRFLPTLDTGQVVDIASRALGAVLHVHRSFQESALAGSLERTVPTCHFECVSEDPSELGLASQPRVDSRESEALSKQDAADSIIEMSSFSDLFPNSLVMNSDTSRHRHTASKTEIAAQKLAGFSNSKSIESHMKLSGTEVHFSDSTELQEIVIGGGSSDAAAGVGELQLQQRRRIAHSVQVEQRDIAAAGVGCVSAKTVPRAEIVRKTTLAALALNPRGRSSGNSLIAAIRKPIESTGNHNLGQERERAPVGSGVTLAMASASLQPQLFDSAHVEASQISNSQHLDVALSHKYTSITASQLQFDAAAEMQIPQPPPRSRSRSRNVGVTAIDPPARTFTVPPPPPRSRSSSRTRISAGAQNFSDAKFPPEFSQVLSAPIAVPISDIASLKPPDAATKRPDTVASGGSIRVGSSSKKAGSKQPKKSNAQLMLEKQQAEYEESMRRMEKDGITFFEC